MSPFHRKAEDIRKVGIQCAGCGQPIVWQKNKRKPKYCSQSCAAATRELSKRKTPRERLMNHRIITETGCWELDGKARTKFGYRPITVNKRTEHAHRWAYEVFQGAIPDGMCVLHRCDNPGCFNPEHLWLGTLADNNHDCAQKGRNDGFFNGKGGERHPGARLTDTEAHEVRRLKQSGMRQKHIAALFNLSQMTVSQIVRDLTYRSNSK